ncbi:hypothetical protein [Flavobacterium hankyongi]|uniref:Uncharacterized protein n=2 Tax=Flavobacteriaceae TaxID=49546 RepID=A0ABP8ZJA2_9FLAO
MQKIINQKNRLQWHKNTLIEKSGYVLYYMNSLKNHLTVEERQTLYMVSKFFTDGVESARANINLAEYFFAIGEHYQKKVSNNNLLLSQLIWNSYDRAKSYYYFKIKNYDMALERIYNTLEINKNIRDKFPIIIFDSISHYKNLLKVLVFKEEINEANNMVYEIVNFLISGKTSLEPLNDCYETIEGDEYQEFRLFFLNDLIFNYMFLNSEFNDSKSRLISLFNYNKEQFQRYMPLYHFLEIYLSESIEPQKINFFNATYDKYFGSIPLEILKEKQLV